MRLIDADAFREFLEQIRQDYREEDTLSSGFAACLIETVQDEYLALAPTVETVEVVHGRWKPYYETFDEDKAVGVMGGEYQTGWLCSVCGRYEPTEEPYCNCGAKMDGDGNG